MEELLVIEPDGERGTIAAHKYSYFVSFSLQKEKQEHKLKVNKPLKSIQGLCVKMPEFFPKL